VIANDTDAAVFTKAGTGTLTLSGTNTYTGVTTISNGILEITNNDGLGSDTGKTVISSGAQLTLENALTLTENIDIASTGTTAGIYSASDTILQGNLVILGSSSILSEANLTLNGSGTITKSTGDSANLHLKAYGNIVIDNSITSTSNALNLVIIADADATTNGSVLISDNITTNAGHIWIGGGSGSATWNGLTVGDSFAVANDANNGSLTSAAGKAILIKDSTISTAAGSFYANGKSNSTVGGVLNIGLGILNSSIQSTTGSITLIGTLAGDYAIGAGISFGTNQDAVDSQVTISSTDGNISITGTASESASNYSTGDVNEDVKIGIAVITKQSDDYVKFISTSGDISLDGSFSSSIATSTNSSGILLQTYDGIIEITSQTGNITIDGAHANEDKGTNVNGIKLAVDYSNNDLANDRAGNLKIGYDGTNSYSGNVTITSDSIRLANSNQSGSGLLAIEGTGNLIIQPEATSFTYLRTNNLGTETDIDFDNDISFGTGWTSFTLGKDGNSKDISITNPIQVNGPITIHGGDVTLSANLTAASGTSLIKGVLEGTGDFTQTTGTLQVNATGDNTLYTGDIKGDGAFTKLGNSILALSGANTYTGDTTISAGTLTIDGTGTLEGGSYDGAISNSGTFIYSSTTDQVLSGIISGDGALTKQEDSSLTLSGANTYTGATLISAGVLRAQNDTALGTTASGTTVASGAALELNDLDDGTAIAIGAEALSLAGTGISNGGALRNIAGNNSYAGAITLTADTRINSDSGTLTLNVASGAAITGTFNLTFGGAGNIAVSDAITTGTGTLTKDGTGTLTLAGNNTYTGATTISTGIVAITHANALGKNGETLSTTTVSDGATLSISHASTINVPEPITISGTGVLSAGAIQFTGSGANTYSGAIILGANATISSIGSGGTTFSGTINATSSGAQSLTISTTTDDFVISGAIGGTTRPSTVDISAIGTGRTLSIEQDISSIGDQTFRATAGITISGARTFTSTSGTINTVSALSGNNSFTISGNADIDGAITGITTFSVSGTSDLGNNITTSSTQQYDGVTTLSTNVILTTTDSNVTFNDKVISDGTQIET
jgi:fibronectin-binding autotransporter adhesin